MMLEILWIAAAYFIGALPFGVIIAKLCKGIDPRQEGSCNPGATNVARLCGFSFGLLTLVCDLLKGALPVAFAIWWHPNAVFFHSIVALAALTGHLKSFFLGFKGGKGVATTVGVLLPIAFFPWLCSAVLCLLVIWRSSHVSLGALALVTALPIFCLLLGSYGAIPLTLVILLIVFWTHRSNIERLAKGQEKSWKKSA